MATDMGPLSVVWGGPEGVRALEQRSEQTKERLRALLPLFAAALPDATAEVLGVEYHGYRRQELPDGGVDQRELWTLHGTLAMREAVYQVTITGDWPGREEVRPC